MTAAKHIARTFALTAEHIAEAADLIGEHLEALGMEHTHALRNRLAAEEILLNWQGARGLSETFTVEISRRMGRVSLVLRCQGPAADPLGSEGDFDSAMGRQILANLGLGFTWQYQDGVNVASVSQKAGRGLSQIQQMLIAIGSALILGFAGLALPEAWRGLAVDGVLEPLFNTFLGLFSCIVGPMMFLSMVWSIVNIGDVRKLGRIGGKLLSRFLVVTTLFSVVSLLCVLAVLRPSLGDAQSSGAVLKSVVEMVLNVAPRNIVDPFREGNTLQILFMGIAVGVAIILLRDRMQTLTSLVEQSNAVVQLLLSAISAAVPVFVFLSVLRLTLQGTLVQNMKVLFQAVALAILLSALEMVVETLSLMKLGVSPVQAVKKLSPPFLIALTTASSGATLPTMMGCCRKELGIDEKLMNFALPFGSVVFMPHTAATFVVIPLFIAPIYGVELAVGGLVLCLINAVVLSVATPPVPGGMVGCFTLMFLQLGIPLEAISLAVAANVVLDFVVTAGDLHTLLVQLTHGAKRLKLLDEAVLRGEA